MYTSNINMTQHAATLPRKTTTSMMATTVMAPNRNVYCLNGVSVSGSNGGDDTNQESNQQNQQFGDYIRRPTYGAYANMTLPRGPYLQYKFHANYDNNTINRISKNNSAKITTSSNMNNCNDNNSENRITLLKREFNGLPRAKLHQNPSHNLQLQYTNKKFEQPINGINKLNTRDQLNQYQYHNNSFTHLPPPSLSPLHPSLHYQGYSSVNTNSYTNSLLLNYVTLADVIHVKPGGLNQLEGWALLCQSVQALQDMFLAGKLLIRSLNQFLLYFPSHEH